MALLITADCIIPDPERRETREQLQDKFELLNQSAVSP